MRIFHEGELSEFLDGQIRKLTTEVHGEPENKLLNVDRTQYVDYLVDKYRVDAIEFLWDEMTVDQSERMIPAEQHGFGWNVYPGKSYPRQVLVYELSYVGTKELLRLAPSTRVMWTEDLKVSDSAVWFEVVNFNLNPDQIKAKAEYFTSHLKRQSDYSRKDVNEFNKRLRARVESTVDHRKSQLLENRQLLNDLGVPVRRSNDVPSTFSIDAPKRKLITKPEAPSSDYEPEPTLHEKGYSEILEVINHVGREMERHPATYAGHGEEMLRDFLLMALTPNFESTTGETFNKAGKTDILIRHEGSNVFVAECAVWYGKKKFLAKIDQALSYLTWRDSKVAIVVFARLKTIHRVFADIVSSTPSHPQWTHTYDDSLDGTYRYEFCLPGDPSRGVRVTVMVFHLPEEKGGPSSG